MQNNVPYVMVCSNNGYLSPDPATVQVLYDMDYAVNIGYGDGFGPDFVKIMEGFGGAGQAGRQARGDQAGPGLGGGGVQPAEDPGLGRDPRGPETDAAMGVSIDKIVERDPIIDIPADAPVKEPAAVR